jgi:hypothetical protein
VRAGLDPWGRFILSDFITAARVKRQEQFQNNLQLAKMVGALFAGKPELIESLVPKE